MQQLIEIYYLTTFQRYSVDKTDRCKVELVHPYRKSENLENMPTPNWALLTKLELKKCPNRSTYPNIETKTCPNLIITTTQDLFLVPKWREHSRHSSPKLMITHECGDETNLTMVIIYNRTQETNPKPLITLLHS